jgi:hypothetical protein
MGLAPGYQGYGTGPAGKTHKNTMGQSPAPNVVKPKGKSGSTSFRGGISRGNLGKRGR